MRSWSEVTQLREEKVERKKHNYSFLLRGDIEQETPFRHGQGDVLTAKGFQDLLEPKCDNGSVGSFFSELCLSFVILSTRLYLFLR